LRRYRGFLSSPGAQADYFRRPSDVSTLHHEGEAITRIRCCEHPLFAPERPRGMASIESHAASSCILERHDGERVSLRA